MKELYFHILGTPSDADFTVYPTQVIEGKRFLLDYTLNLIGSNPGVENTCFTATNFVEVRLYGFASTSNVYDASFDGASDFFVLGYVISIQGSGNSNIRFPASCQFTPNHPIEVHSVTQGPWRINYFDLSTNANLQTVRIQNSSAFLRLRCIDDTPRNRIATRAAKALGSVKTYQLRSTDRVTNVTASQAVQSFRLAERPLDPGLFRLTFTFVGAALNTGNNYQTSLWMYGVSCPNYQTLLSQTGGLLTTGSVRTTGFGDSSTNGICIGSFQQLPQPGVDLGITPRGGRWMFGAGFQRAPALFDDGFSIVADRFPTQISFIALNNNTGALVAMGTLGMMMTVRVAPYDDETEYHSFADDYDNFYGYNS